MDTQGPIRQLRFICVMNKGVGEEGSGTSKGKWVINSQANEKGQTFGVRKNSCWATREQWDTEGNLVNRFLFGSSLSAYLIHMLLR